ncbi:MAG: Holliday junction branch migration protein RuvA, partial [Proteobacteria bacterium]
MIAFIHGQIIERNEDGLVVNVNGVGYDLSCSQNTLDDSLSSDEGRFFVHTSVREDAITLFGFSTTTEKAMFLSLLKVNGVGPKMAIKILSGASMNELSRMIEMGDVKALSNLPKVGKKTAEQLILTLKGKLVLSQEEPKAPKSKIQLTLAPKFEGTRADVLSALVNLGFRPQDAERVVGDLPEDVEVQSGIRTG